MAAYFAAAQHHTWSSIIILTSLTLGADMIDGELLMTLGWNCYDHKSDMQYLKGGVCNWAPAEKEHSHLSTDYCWKWLKVSPKIITEHFTAGKEACKQISDL